MRISNLAKVALAGAVAVATLGVVAAPAVAAPTAPKVPAAAPTAAGTMTSVVDGTFADGGKLTGTFTPAKFANQNGTLVAIGTLHSVLTDGTGAAAGTTDTSVTLPVQLPAGATKAAAAISCSVLHLVLGPLDLNLLGLVVHLNTVVLDITAVPGAGNLLGNLLCALTGILDGGLNLPLNTIAALLNAILGLLSL
jgi:hypothetical protein